MNRSPLRPSGAPAEEDILSSSPLPGTPGRGVGGEGLKSPEAISPEYRGEGGPISSLLRAALLRPLALASGRVWFLLGLIVLFGALSVQYSVKALHNRSAFDRWKGMVVSGVENGDDIAAKYAYPNPPIMAVVLYPFAKLPSVWGALAWFYVKVGLTLLAFHWVFQLVETPGRPFPLWRRRDRPAQSAADHRRPPPRQRQPFHPVPGRRRPGGVPLPPRSALRPAHRPGRRL